MRRLVFILLLVGSVATSKAQKASCRDYRTGDFKIITGRDVTYIKRTAKFQTETGNDGWVKLKITWLDSCTYRLQAVGFSKSLKKRLSKAQQKEVVICNIVSVTPRYYYQKSWLEGNPDVIVFEGKVYRNE